MNVRFLKLLQFIVLTMDLVMLNLVMVGIHLLMDRTHGSVGYVRFWMWLNISWLVVTRFTDQYAEKNLRGFEVFARGTLRSFLYWLALVMVYLFFTRQFQLSRLYIFWVISMTGTTILLNRFLYLFLLHRLRHRDHLRQRVLIVGFNETARQLANVLETASVNTSIVGFCENEENVRELSHYPILGRYDNMVAHWKQYRITEIYSTIAPEHDEGIYRLMQEADQACIRFKVVPDLRHFIRRPVHVDYMGQLPVLSIRREPLDDVANRIRKRVFDMVVSSLAILLVLWWLVPLIGLLVWLEDRGPVFFRQQRSGKNNETFYCLKFRSMRVNREADLRQASRNDDRFTRIGRFLRKSNLDEMPQFFNVFVGEMSVVGPRPHMLKHTQDYAQLLNQFMIRHFAKPGITGWAQVNGFRGETKHLEDMRGRVEHDLWYLENWSLWLDVRILLMTAFRMVKGEKNAF